MKVFPVGLDTLLATRNYVQADLYDFTLTDINATHLRYTTADADVLYAGNVYTSKGPFFESITSKSRAHWKAGLDLDTWTVVVSPKTIDEITGVQFPAKIFGQPWLAAVRVGALQGAIVDIHRGYWPAPWPSRPFTISTAPIWGGSASGLVSQWFMDDSHVSGATLTDSVDANNGTISGGVTSTAGPPAAFYSTARAYDGLITSHINLATVLDLSTAFTLGMWVNMADNTIAGAGGFRQTFFYSNKASPYSELRFMNNTSINPGVVTAGFKTGLGVVGVTTNSAVLTSNNHWYHLGITYDGAGVTTLYVDGAPASTSAAADESGNIAGFSQIGGLNGDGSGVGVFKIYNTVLYNRALSAGEMATLHSADVGPFAPSVVGTPYLIPTYVLVDLFAGKVADIQISRSAAIIAINSFVEVLSRQMPRNLFQSSCRHTLYDAGCSNGGPVVRGSGSFTFNGAVTLRFNDGNFNTNITNVSPHTNDFFTLGMITWLTGNNLGFSRGVREFTQPNGNFQLITPMPYAIQVGDTFTAYAGCDKSMGTCSGRFGNLNNFGGFPFIPIPEVAT